MKIWQWNWQQWNFHNENSNNENLTMKLQQWKFQQWKTNNEMWTMKKPTMKMVVAEILSIPAKSLSFPMDQEEKCYFQKLYVVDEKETT